MANERAADSAQLTAFIDKAPELSALQFRSFVTTHKFEPPWSIVDAFELPDGTLYLSVEPPLPPPATAGDVPQEVGILHAGVLTQIKLPERPRVIGFVGTLAGKPVISTMGSERFVLNGSKARRLSETEQLDVRKNATNFGLHDDSSCTRGPIGSTTAVFSNRNGRSRALVTTAAMQRAFGWPIHVDPLDITCATFDREDYLDVDGFLIFRLHQGEPQLVARARIWASGAHHILMTSESLPSDPHSSYYLEATAP